MLDIFIFIAISFLDHGERHVSRSLIKSPGTYLWMYVYTYKRTYYSDYYCSFLADSDIHTHTQVVQYVHIYFVIIHVYVCTCIYSFQDNRYENQRYVLKAGTTKNPDEVCAYITHGKRMCITSFTGNECVQMNISVRTWKNA